MSDIQYFTEEGLNKLKDELECLKSVERPKVIQQIAEARDKGDLSENAEYETAKDRKIEQAIINELSDAWKIFYQKLPIKHHSFSTPTFSLFSRQIFNFSHEKKF